MDDQSIAIRTGFNLAGPGGSKPTLVFSEKDPGTPVVGPPDVLLEGHHAKPGRVHRKHDLGFTWDLGAPAQSMQLLVTSDSRHWQAVHGALLTHQILRSPDVSRVAGGRKIPTEPGESLRLSSLQILADASRYFPISLLISLAPEKLRWSFPRLLQTSAAAIWIAAFSQVGSHHAFRQRRLIS